MALRLTVTHIHYTFYKIKYLYTQLQYRLYVNYSIHYTLNTFYNKYLFSYHFFKDLTIDFHCFNRFALFKLTVAMIIVIQILG